MKILIASDIHGSAYYCRRLIDRINDENPDIILLLGDLLYHGPRNDLPRDYAPKEVIEMLDGISSKLLCVRGNCDGEVEQAVLSFRVLNETVVIADGSHIYAAVHGHHIAEPKMTPNLGDIVFCGHTHIPGVFDAPECDKSGRKYINPGSVSIPREDTPHSYMTCIDGCLNWKDVESGEVYREYRI